MKILFISTMPDYWWGGSEELWVAAAEEAVAQGHQLVLSFPSGRNEPHAKLVGLYQHSQVVWHYRQLPTPSFFQRAQQKLERRNTPYHNVPHEWFKTLQTVEQFQPDFIYINQGWVTTVAEDLQLFWLVQTYRKAPYFILSHQNAEHRVLDYTLLNKWKALVPLVRRWYFISERNKKVAQRQLAMPTFTNWAIVKNPCNTIRAKLLSFPQTSKVTFAFIGRLECMHKGLDLLLEAFASGKWKRRNWGLNIYGEGKDKMYLYELVQYYQLQNRVHFKGYTQNIEEVWRENQLLILPSIKEGFPLVIAEAMQHGRAVIATNVGDSCVLVKEGKTGFLVEAATTVLLAEALERAWQKKSEWEQLGKNAFEESKLFIDPHAGETLLNLMLSEARQA